MVHSPDAALTNSAVVGTRRSIRLTTTAHCPALTALTGTNKTSYKNRCKSKANIIHTLGKVWFLLSHINVAYSVFATNATQIQL